MDYREEMKQLRDRLNDAGYRYYVLDDPDLPDHEYDRMLRRLEELEAEHPKEITPDSPTQRVGGQALDSFTQVEHPVPLESLQDVFSQAEVEEFAQRMEETLADKGFIRCNKGYLVNLAHVSGVRDGCAVVQGDKLLISRGRRGPFLSALADYVGGISG